MMDPLILLKILIFLALGIVISYYDIKFKKIPNELVILMFFSGLAINWKDFNWSQLLFVTIISYFSWRFKFMGAGDSKLIIAIQSFMNFDNMNFILYAIIGAILFYFLINIKKIKTFKLNPSDFAKYVIYYFPILFIIRQFTQNIIGIVIILIITWKFIDKFKEDKRLKVAFLTLGMVCLGFAYLNGQLTVIVMQLFFILLIILLEKIIEHTTNDIKFGPFLILGGLI